MPNVKWSKFMFTPKPKKVQGKAKGDTNIMELLWSSFTKMHQQMGKICSGFYIFLKQWNLQVKWEGMISLLNIIVIIGHINTKQTSQKLIYIHIHGVIVRTFSQYLHDKWWFTNVYSDLFLKTKDIFQSYNLQNHVWSAHILW